MQRVMSVALVALLAVGCGTAGAKDVLIVTSHPHGATAAANQKAAEREGKRLVDHAVLPGGAVRVDHGPKTLSGPGLGTPSVDTLVDAVGYWHVSTGLQATYDWLKQHGQGGLQPEASGGGEFDHGQPVYESLSYWAGRTAAYQSAELEFAVGDDGKGQSVVRVDGVVVWLDPKPVPDTGAVNRIHFDVSDGCPASDAKGYALDGVDNSGNDLRSRLLPAARPTGALLCHYAPGLNNKHPHALTRQVLLNANDAANVAAAANKLPLSHVDGGVTSCPAYDPGTALVAFSYAGRADVDLAVGLGGCASVGNGFIRTSTGALAELVLRLVRA